MIDCGSYLKLQDPPYTLQVRMQEQYSISGRQGGKGGELEVSVKAQVH